MEELFLVDFPVIEAVPRWVWEWDLQFEQLVSYGNGWIYTTLRPRTTKHKRNRNLLTIVARLAMVGSKGDLRAGLAVLTVVHVL